LRVKNEMNKVRLPLYAVQIKNKLVFKNNRQILGLKRDFMLSLTVEFISVSDEEMKRSYIAQLSHFLLKEYFLCNKLYAFSCKYLRWESDILRESSCKNVTQLKRSKKASHRSSTPFESATPDSSLLFRRFLLYFKPLMHHTINFIAWDRNKKHDISTFYIIPPLFLFELCEDRKHIYKKPTPCWIFPSAISGSV
jgi:hypothetical protein